MGTRELTEKINAIKWFHSIPLPTDEGDVIVTPGITRADHCDSDVITSRFGMPEDLTGLTLLDIGTYDGLMAFEAEKRGAIVSAIDPLQGRGGINEVIGGEGITAVIKGNEGFKLAKTQLGSKVKYAVTDLQGFVNGIGPYSQRGLIKDTEFDVVLYFGVLYHTESPLLELKHLFKTIKKGGYALIETAISPNIQLNGQLLPLWQFWPGHDGDDTNFWYCSLAGLETALKHVGFTKVELIYAMPGGERCTVKCLK